MLVFNRRWGLLLRDDKPIGAAYAGGHPGPKGEDNSKAVNNPEFERIHNVGPLPAGNYKITKIKDQATIQRLHMGPIVYYLTPDEHTRDNTFGRTGFLIHWDNTKADFSASEGCIVPLTVQTFSRFNDGETIVVV